MAKQFAIFSLLATNSDEEDEISDQDADDDVDYLLGDAFPNVGDELWGGPDKQKGELLN